VATVGWKLTLGEAKLKIGTQMQKVVRSQMIREPGAAVEGDAGGVEAMRGLGHFSPVG